MIQISSKGAACALRRCVTRVTGVAGHAILSAMPFNLVRESFAADPLVVTIASGSYTFVGTTPVVVNDPAVAQDLELQPGVRYATGSPDPYVPGPEYMPVRVGSDGSSVDGDYTDAPSVLSDLSRFVSQRAEGIHGPARFPGAVICLRFDDGPSVDASTVAPLLAARNLPATFAIIGNRVDTANNMTSADLQSLNATGHELACHSWFHNPSGVPGTYAQLKADTLPANTLLNGLSGVHPTETFVQPGGWSGIYNFDDDSKLSPASPTGRWMRSLYSNVHGYVVPDKLPGNTGRAFPVRPDGRIGGSSHMTITDLLAGDTATVTAAIDNAVLYGSQLTLLVHSWELGTGGKLTVANLTTILDYIVTQRNAGLLDCATLACATHAGRGTRDNLMVDPNFALSSTGSLKGGWVALGGGPTIEAGGYSGGKRAVIGDLTTTRGIAWRYPAGNLRSFEVEYWARPVGASATQVRVQIQQGPSGGSSLQNRSAVSSLSIPANTWTRIRAIGRTVPGGGDLTIRPWVQNNAQPDVQISDFRVSRV